MPKWVLFFAEEGADEEEDGPVPEESVLSMIIGTGLFEEEGLNSE